MRRAGRARVTGVRARPAHGVYGPYFRKQIPENPLTPPHCSPPPKLSLAIHRPALVSSMPSAPSPRDLEYSPAVPAALVSSAPPDEPGVTPARPGAGIAPGPAALQPFALCSHRL